MAEETDWGGGKGGRAMPSIEWVELFTGKTFYCTKDWHLIV